MDPAQLGLRCCDQAMASSPASHAAELAGLRQQCAELQEQLRGASASHSTVHSAEWRTRRLAVAVCQAVMMVAFFLAQDVLTVAKCSA